MTNISYILLMCLEIAGSSSIFTWLIPDNFLLHQIFLRLSTAAEKVIIYFLLLILKENCINKTINVEIIDIHHCIFFLFFIIKNLLIHFLFT